MADTIKTNLGPVTAYADAKAHGYTGTREEFGVLLANAGLNLKAAEAAKTDAEAAKQAAETAQQAAAENQKNTETQAANAKASADTAAEQAAVAKESAADAANSATAAQESETNAGLSATAAANAEAAAKQAQNAAETAKADAETAKTAAGNSADAAANSAADAKKTLESIPADYSTLSGKVDENANGISELKEDLANKNFAELHDISFEENMIDLSCIIEGFINENGDYQYEAQWQFINKFVPVKPNTKYYRLVNSVYEQIVLYDNSKNFIGVIKLYADIGTGKDGYFETPENCYFIKFQAVKSESDYNTQVYSQIRPTKYVESNTTAKITIPYNVYSENVKESETSDVVCWGDSLTEGANGATPYTTKLAELLGSNYTVINRGKGGDTAEGIACRQGGLPIYLQPCSLSNTAHEAVNVVFKNIIDESVKPMFDSAYNGQRANINGKSYYISLRGENRQPVLCAYTDGEGQTIDRPYYLHFGEYDTLKNKTMVIWSGSNNAPNEETVENVIQKIRAMIAYNGNNNYIVIGLTSLTAMPDVLKCNRKMALAFDIHFLDISNYLRNYALDDLGISETSQDVIDKNNGDIPSSLRTDPVHLTSGANEVVANQIYKKGKELGYW